MIVQRPLLEVTGLADAGMAEAPKAKVATTGTAHADRMNVRRSDTVSF
jgi:hypothetical protein